MNDKTICRNDGRCEYAIQSGAEKEGSCPARKCAMPCDNSAAHLTIPGALEWDGDNGTHGVVGTHGADGESSELEQLRKKTAVTMGVGCGAGQLFVHGDSESIHAAKAIVLEGERLRAQLDNTEQSRRSFFDLSQDLEKRLVERDALLRDIELTMDGQPDSMSIGYDVECRMAAILRPVGHAKPTKTKICIECDQPYCHGVCVERGDQDYDRDQAAKGGEQ